MRGFGPLLRYELARWWRVRHVLGQLLLWTVLISGVVAAALWGTPDGPNPAGVVSSRVGEAARGLVVAFGVIAPIGAVIAVQGALIGERHDGSMAWLLSLPCSRVALLLAKALAQGSGLLVTVIVAQGVVSLVLVQARLGSALSVQAQVGALLLFGLYLLFYLGLGLLLGTVVPGRGWLIGIAVLVLLAQEISPLPVLPVGLVKLMAQPLLETGRVDSFVPLASTLLCTVACFAAAGCLLERRDL